MRQIHDRSIKISTQHCSLAKETMVVNAHLAYRSIEPWFKNPILNYLHVHVCMVAVGLANDGEIPHRCTYRSSNTKPFGGEIQLSASC